MLNSLSQYTRDAIIQDVIGIEAGYVNNPDDPGKATSWGITYATAAHYQDQLVALFQWDGTMAHLTPAMATWIYQQGYWNPLNLDAILALGGEAPLVADLLFEAGVNIGITNVARLFQTVLNVLNQQATLYPDLVLDGQLGSKSVSALQSLLKSRPSDGLPNVLFLLTCEVGHYYTSISMQTASLETFTSGWANRARTQFEAYVAMYQ